MSSGRTFFYRGALPVLASAVFLLMAGICFAVKHGEMAAFWEFVEPESRKFFLLNFYLSLAICFASLGCVSLLPHGFAIGRWVSLFFALVSSICGAYLLHDYFTIKIFIYSAFLLTALLALPLPRNYIITVIALPVFALSLFLPFYLVAPTAILPGMPSPVPHTEQIVLVIVIMLSISLMAAFIRYLLEKDRKAETTINHLKEMGTKMQLFNYRLQESVRNTGDEAVRKDRLRFTSDLHDSSGYVFTNIIAITEAGISWADTSIEKTRETLKMIQNQARDGLKRTRETLYAIRSLRDPEMGIIETIFKMKSILEDITDIAIDIEIGNLKKDYHPEIRQVLIRTVQEAFTNSMRHGQATRIIISFWESSGSLFLSVRDNGIGSQEIVKGIGMAGMEERLVRLGGTLDAYSPPDGGFCLKIHIPLDVTEKTNEGILNITERYGENGKAQDTAG